MSAIEALYIYDQNNDCILEHVYRSRPAPPAAVIAPYLAHPKPRPSVIYLDNVNPPTAFYSLSHSNILLSVPDSGRAEPLFVLEFLHRVIDVLEEFLGAPLLASKIESAYDVVAQLLHEMCDAGSVCNTEPNALRDDVDVTGWAGKLLEGLGLPGSSQGLLPQSTRQQPALKLPSDGPAIPWRKANVRHTSNELYIDIVEQLSVVFAPSGRPLSAFANGSIVCNSKISGVPDVLLTLSVAGGKLGLERTIELPVFHPCVRLARWKDRPGDLSFIPPDGKFVLAGYEVNLLPLPTDVKSWANANVQLPATLQVRKGLGSNGTDLEVTLNISSNLPGVPSIPSASRPGLGNRGSGRSTPVFGGGGTSSSPTLQAVSVSVPLPSGVQNVTEIQASRGEAFWNPSGSSLEWQLAAKDAAPSGIATLRCTVLGSYASREDTTLEDGTETGENAYDYDEDNSARKTSKGQLARLQDQRDRRQIQQNASLMPRAASVSFSVKGWLASGIKVEALSIDPRKSRGLGEGVKPYKGVKYLTVSRKGVETRC